MTSRQWAAGIDLGGTKINVSAVDKQGQLLGSTIFPTAVKDGPQAIQNSIVAAVDKLTADIGSRPQAAGVGIAGQIDAATGEVFFAPNLAWHRVPLQHNLSQVLKAPVVVTNDVRAATWGEWIHGAGVGCNDLVCLFVGTGIGGGVVSGGRLLVGHTNCAGELGHTVVNLHGPACTCGGRGCLEAYASGWAIAKAAQQAIDDDPDTGREILRLSNGPATTKGVSLAARVGDPLGQQLIHNATDALIAGITSFVNAFNPEKVILGGGVMNGLPELIPSIEAGVRQRALKSATQSFSIVPSTLRANAGVVGAATLGWTLR